MARKSASQSPYHAGLAPSATGLGAASNPVDRAASRPEPT